MGEWYTSDRYKAAVMITLDGDHELSKKLLTCIEKFAADNGELEVAL